MDQEVNYIDLGLSVKWADRNIGANLPREFGEYYTDTWHLLEGNLPTNTQWEELQSLCTFIHDDVRNGIIATGPNGNSIFLPYAGEKGGHTDKNFSNALFWTSTPYYDEFKDKYSWYAGFSKSKYSKKVNTGMYFVDKGKYYISVRTVEAV